MPRWNDGYVTDVAYTTSFFRELTPAWIGMSALMLGYRPPDLAAPFRYADLGCGNGFTALVVAATCPHAEVWGFDFNPVHIEFATNLASRASLTNAHSSKPRSSISQRRRLRRCRISTSWCRTAC